VATTLPVLTFHAVDDQASVISYPPRVFREGMAELDAQGYRTIGLAPAVAAVRQGGPFPDRAFVLTFDDGFQSVYTEAFPVLQRYGMSATVFLIAGPDDAGGRLPAFEGRAMLSWPEIREMQQAGVEFGAHTLTHPDLTRLSADAVAREVTISKARIEDALGTRVSSFAYPFGRYDARARDLVREHFSCACADALGLVSARSDPYALERVDAYYLRTRRQFALMLTGLFPWYVRARDVPRRLRRAVQRRRPAAADQSSTT
jgi:peptidoglycan/xylan/chitin deacetylase (PgdA/CDA1 family)